jgi:hypothetical protein
MFTPGWGGSAGQPGVVMTGGMAASVTSITDVVHNSRGQTSSERTPEGSSRRLWSRSRSVDQSPGSEEGGDGKHRKEVS